MRGCKEKMHCLKRAQKWSIPSMSLFHCCGTSYRCVPRQQVRHLGGAGGAAGAPPQRHVAGAALRQPGGEQHAQAARAAGDDVLRARVQELRLRAWRT